MKKSEKFHKIYMHFILRIKTNFINENHRQKFDKLGINYRSRKDKSS